MMLSGGGTARIPPLETQNTGPLKPFPWTPESFYITTEAEANLALRHIVAGEVGFDTEFTHRRPTTQEKVIDKNFPGGGPARRAALLGWQLVELASGTLVVAWDKIGLRLVQIAHGKKVWVLDMWKIKAIPQELARILVSPVIKKGGVALANDILVIWDDLRINPSNMVDVGFMARLAMVEHFPNQPFTNMSLKASVESVLGYTISKDLAESDWSTPDLSTEQIQYAALDAVVSLRLLEALTSRLEQKSAEIGETIRKRWYTFNSRNGQPIRQHLSPSGADIPWRSADCSWYAGGKFTGYH